MLGHVRKRENLSCVEDADDHNGLSAGPSAAVQAGASTDSVVHNPSLRHLQDHLGLVHPAAHHLHLCHGATEPRLHEQDDRDDLGARLGQSRRCGTFYLSIWSQFLVLLSINLNLV